MFCARETKKHSRPITRAGWFATVRAEKRIFFSFFWLIKIPGEPCDDL